MMTLKLRIDLAQKENICINAICPGIVHTSIIPQEMVDAVSPDW
jgi:NAD(P)-dependent dehydrogenase (short-subunit alcohol dehydrogenase family)